MTSQNWEDKALVAAIDFGTTFSGVALSFVSEYQKDKTNIFCPLWKSGSHPTTYKTPTVLLLNPARELDSFGYEAEEKYADLVEKKQYKDWFYFSLFKMMLHGDRNLSLESFVTDSEGRQFPAIKIFSLSIGYFKSKIRDVVNDKEPFFDESDMYYVITTPAIWSEKAKTFMRLAAEQAGIPTDHIRIALEPECAAVYVKTLDLVTKFKGASTDVKPLSPNSCYMVVDMGGGTIDLTVHSVTADGKIHEKIIPKGGPWGGHSVNEKFRQFLIKLVGAKAFTNFRSTEREDYLEMMRDFEVKKCAWRQGANAKFRLPASLVEIHKDENQEQLYESIRETRFSSSVSFCRDKMTVDKSEFEEFFNETIQETVDCIDNTIRSLPLNIDTLLLVGGFSDCDLMKKAIKDKFPDKIVLIPPGEAVWAVVKGAILYGRDPTLIENRICRYTYGLECNEHFDPVKHPMSTRVFSDSGYLCPDIFRVLVKKGESVASQREEILDCVVKNTDQAQMHFPFYRSELESEPMFVHDTGCYKIGTLVIDLPDGLRNLDMPVKLHVKFGATEIDTEAIDYIGRRCAVHFNLFETQV